jgi:multidrug efflux pump subunit AcrB
VRTANGATIYLKDVANVRDGFSPQTNVVRQDGARGVLLSILKNGGASTLDIVDNLRKLLPTAPRPCRKTSRSRRCSTSRCS